MVISTTSQCFSLRILTGLAQEWSCCGLTAHAPPCVTREFHDPPHGSEAIKKRWQFYRTPAEKKPTHRIAVAIDCEMGIAEDEESELIRVTLVDFFSGEALIDKLVLPHVRLKSFSTAFSGVTKADMEAARRSNQCFRGKDAAREAVLEFVGPQTIVVGHSAGGDFSSLRWIYNRIIDTLVIEAARRKQLEDLTDQMNALSVGATEESNDPFDDAATVRNTKNIARGRGHRTFNPDGLSLKALTLKRLGREIQLGNNGHDSLEDAIAPRNLVDYLVTSMC